MLLNKRLYKNVNCKDSKVLFRATWAYRLLLISVSLALSQTPAYVENAGVNASLDVLVYSSAFAGTHCAGPLRDLCGRLRSTQPSTLRGTVNTDEAETKR